MSRQLRAGRDSTERFSIETAVNALANALYQAYKAEVELRGAKPLSLDRDTMRHIYAAAEWLANPRATCSLMLCGLFGNGKTTLATAMKNLIEKVSEIELGYSNRKIVAMHTAKEICKIAMTNQERYDRICREELLIVDELGEEPLEVLIFGNMMTPIVDLISERYAQRRFTILVTNHEKKELRKRYGGRIYDRFSEMLTSIVFENESYRERNKGNRQVADARR